MWDTGGAGTRPGAHLCTRGVAKRLLGNLIRLKHVGGVRARKNPLGSESEQRNKENARMEPAEPELERSSGSELGTNLLDRVLVLFPAQVGPGCFNVVEVGEVSGVPDGMQHVSVATSTSSTWRFCPKSARRRRRSGDSRGALAPAPRRCDVTPESFGYSR